MTFKTLFLLCLAIFAIKANDQLMDEKLAQLGLGFTTAFDYNDFILNLETIIEEFQQVALDAIESSVEIAQELAKSVATLKAQDNVKDICQIQTNYFKIFEDVRKQAYNQNIDVSDCVSSAVEQVYINSKISVDAITEKMQNITAIFSNYTAVNYLQPAKDFMEKSYTMRERIYKCPFSFTDFLPFYSCLVKAQVLNDAIELNQFSLQFNDTTTAIYKLFLEFADDALYFQDKNVQEFSDSSDKVYTKSFLKCAGNKGFKP